MILEEIITQNIPWGYFDGASQGSPTTCNGGCILYLSDTCYFKLKAGQGQGSNNYAEVLALKLHLLFALEKDCRSIQVFGDLKLIINWVSKI